MSQLRMEVPLEGCVFIAYPLALISFNSEEYLSER